MTKRVDAVISEVHEIHRKYFEEGEGRRDALIVAHVRSLEPWPEDALNTKSSRVTSLGF